MCTRIHKAQRTIRNQSLSRRDGRPASKKNQLGPAAAAAECGEEGRDSRVSRTSGKDREQTIKMYKWYDDVVEGLLNPASGALVLGYLLGRSAWLPFVACATALSSLVPTPFCTEC